MKRYLSAFCAIFVVLILVNNYSFAQTPPPASTQETLQGKVKAISKQEESIINNVKIIDQTMEVYITSGSLKGKTIQVLGGQNNNAGISYKPGDEILILHTSTPDGNDVFYATDYMRKTPLYIAILLFIGLALLISKYRGLTSILGMLLSFLVIFTFVLPAISAGANPTIIAISASLVLCPITFYMSHGINKKTTAAIVGTYVSLIIIGIISVIFVNATKLTGYGTDEAMFLSIVKQGSINIKAVMLAGIIIGALGILDDITISQSSVVFQLHQVTKGELNIIELYQNAMKVGQDHIASVINTLILVYTGASLPLLLLFINNPKPFGEIINYEIIASEIVKTVVGSIGLILAVPITTVISCIFIDIWGGDTDKRTTHYHSH